MQKAFNNFTWENLPSTNTALEADRLNGINNALDTVDDRVVAFDTTKANQSDMLQAVKTISFNSQTGTFRFTFFNNTYVDVDTDIEKIAINFDYDDDPTSAHYQNLIITLDDGTVKYVDMSALITQYEFKNSSRISFSVVNGEVSACIINGSVTEEKLQPNFLADCRSAKAGAETAETNAKASEDEANAWANGEIDGVPVSSTHPAYHNNAKYYKDLANPTSLMALTDTDITNPASGDVLTFNGEKWENKEGISGEEKTAVDEFETINGGLLSECKVALSSNQDLHGYPEPWVGGSRKNKLPMFSPFTESGITAAVASDGTITLNGTSTANINKQLPVNLPAGTYVMSLNNPTTVGTSASNTVYFYAVDSGGSWVMNPLCITANAFGTGTSANGITLVRMSINAGVTLNNFVIKPQLETGSTPTDYESYENICPITGHTEVKVGDDGKNKANISSSTVGSNQNATVEYDNNIIRITATRNYARCGWLIPVEVGKTYTFSCKGITSATGGTMVNIIYLGSADGTWNPSSPNYISHVQLTTELRDVNITFTATTNVCFIGAYVTSTASSGVMTLTDVQLELGSTATPYVPYKGYQVTVNLGGTYYNGTLDVVSGKLTDDGKKGVYTFDGTEWFAKSSRYQGSFYTGWNAFNPTGKAGGQFKCSHAKFVTLASGEYAYGKCTSDNSVNLWLGQPEWTTTDFQNYLATQYANGTPVTIEYEVDSPTETETQLSPTMVKALVGENHLSAPLEGQEIDGVKYNSIAGWNDVVQDGITSRETTWSSDKINTNIGTVASSVTALASRVGTNETNIAGLTTRVGALETNASKITWSNSVNALVDDTTVTISNANITTASIIEPFYSNASGDNVVIKNQTATAGQVVLTFDALLEATSFRVRITNL